MPRREGRGMRGFTSFDGRSSLTPPSGRLACAETQLAYCKPRGDLPHVAAFEFAAEASREENVEAFLSHLDTIDPEMAALLRAHIGKLLPLPDDGARKNRARSSFNSAILAALEVLESPDDNGATS